jgi:hypothetical protein
MRPTAMHVADPRAPGFRFRPIVSNFSPIDGVHVQPGFERKSSRRALSTTLPRLGSWVRIPSPAPKNPLITNRLAVQQICASGKYRQNKTRRYSADPGKIREICSPNVLSHGNGPKRRADRPHARENTSMLKPRRRKFPFADPRSSKAYAREGHSALKPVLASRSSPRCSVSL